MLRIFSLYAIALAALLVVPMNAKAAGSDNFRLSTYACSDVYWGDDYASPTEAYPADEIDDDDSVLSQTAGIRRDAAAPRQIAGVRPDLPARKAGRKKTGDNCVATDEQKLEVIDSMRDDGDDDDAE